MKSIRRIYLVCCGLAYLIAAPGCVFAQRTASPTCPSRPAAGSVVGEPEELRSQKGVLRAELMYRESVDASGQTLYCYVSKDGSEAPTLRLKPGDLLILRLKNEESLPSHPAAGKAPGHPMPVMPDGCTSGEMTPASTNMHFHGLSVPPVCHQDDILHTMIEPGERPFEYRFRIPADEPPGLYWYHPHIHGLTKAQVLGGASGALIVEGIERANAALAGLAERVFIIRDQELVNPNAEPVRTDSMPAPLVLKDAEGDIMNTGTGEGKPNKDLSINFVPVPYPTYPPPVVKMRPAEKQLWCVLNASAITYLDVQMLIGDLPQMVGVVSLDGTPVNENGMSGNRILWESHVLLPPAGRVEFVVKGPPEGVRASFVTRAVDTGPAGENDPTRPIATIVSDRDAPEPVVRLAAAPAPLPRATSIWLGNEKPVRTRTLYFSEQPRDPKDPNGPTDFYITVDGQEPKLFDPNDMNPNIVVRQGDVEDWIIENRTQELHAFHIHQIHFMLVAWNGIPLDEPFLRDTINVAYWDGRSRQYPSVKLRMDFRDPNTVGTFVYHCHLLEHEDSGMMGVVRVDPADGASAPSKTASKSKYRLCGPPLLVAALLKSSKFHASATNAATAANVNAAQLSAP